MASLNQRIEALKKELADLRREFGETSEYQLVGTDPIEQAKELARQIRDYKNTLDEIDDTWGTVSGIINDITKEFGKAKDGFKTALSSFQRLQSISNKFEEDRLGIQRMSSKEIKSQITSIRKEIRVQQQALELLETKRKEQGGLSEAEEKMVAQLKSENEQNSMALDFARKRLAEERQIQKTMGLSGAAVKGMVGALGKLGISADFFEDIEDNMYEAAKSGSKLSAALVGAKGVLGGLREAMSDPIVVGGLIAKSLKALYNLKGIATKYNKEARLASSGMFSGEGLRSMESVYGLFEDLTEAANTLRTELGFVPQMNAKILQGVHVLTKGYGLSGKEAANLYQISQEMGVELKDMPATIASLGGEVEYATGYAVDFQKAMGVVGKASSSVKFNMKGSAEQLIKAANFAAIMGMELDEIRSAAESTLDFESSIQKEMEAEMFLQRDLNLDKYRYAALTGDAATQAGELQRLIKENGPSLKGNVLAQQKFADALGISREQLAESLESMELQQEFGSQAEDVQESINKLMAKGLTKEQALAKIRKEGAEGVTNSIKAEEAFQNRFELAQRKFQEAFTVLAERIFSDANMGKIDDFIKGVRDILMSPIIQGMIKHLPELAAGLLAFNVFKKFNPVQNVGIMNVAQMNGGGGGGGGMGGDYYGDSGGGGGRGKGGPVYDKKTGRYRDPKTGRFTKNPNKGKGGGRSGGRGGRRGFRGRGLGGLAVGLGSALGMNYLLSGGFGGGGDEGYYEDPETGEMTPTEGGDYSNVGGFGMGDVAMMAAPTVAEAGVSAMGNMSTKPPKPSTGGGGSWLSKGWNAVKGAASGAYNSAKGAASGAYNSAKGSVNNMTKPVTEWFGKNIKGIFPKLLRSGKGVLRPVLSKIPFVGAVIEALFTGMDVNDIAKSQDMSPEDVYAEMGASIISGGLGLIGGSLAAAAISAPQAVGIPSWVLAPAAYMGGDWLGRTIGNAISDYIGGPSLGKAVFDMFYGDSGATEMATGGIVTGATRAIVGEAGPEAVVPLNEFYAKLDELIAAVKAGGDVYMDGAKVGKSLVLATSKMG